MYYLGNTIAKGLIGSHGWVGKVGMLRQSFIFRVAVGPISGIYVPCLACCDDDHVWVT